MNNIEELKEPVKNSELHINAQNYPEGCYEELEKLKKEYQSQYADIESKYKDFHGRDDRSAKELMYGSLPIPKAKILFRQIKSLIFLSRIITFPSRKITFLSRKITKTQ